MAGTQERVAQLLLRFKTERQNIQALKQTLTSFERDLNSFKAESEKTNRALEQQVRALHNEKLAAADSRKEIARFAAEQRKAAGEADKTTRAVNQQTRALKEQGQATATKGNSALRALGTDIRNLPAVPIPGTSISTDVVGKILASIGRTQVTFDQLAIGLGVAATAGTALVLVLKGFVDSLAATKQRVLDEIATRQKLNELLVTGTRGVLEAELEMLRIRQKIAELNLADIAPKFAEEFERVASQGPLGLGADALFGILGLNDPVLQANKEAAVAALKALQDVNKEIGIYETALNSAEVATNTAAEAEEKLAVLRQQIADQRIQAQLQAELAVSKMTAEAVRERIAAINLEMRLNLEASQSAEASAELVERLTQRTRDLSAELQVLTNALPEKERMEGAQALFKRIKDGITNFVEEARKRAEDLKKVGQDIAALRSDFSDKLRDIERKRQEQIEDAAYERDQAAIEARRDAALAETEAVRKAGMERVEVERESQANVARILRRSKFDEANAIQARDAVALDMARRRRDDELSEEASNRSERLRELDQGLREELRTINLRLREQQRTIDMRYQEQVRRAGVAAQRQIAIETERFNRELALKVQAAQRILGIEATAKQQEVQIAQNGATANLNVQRSFWQGALTLASNAVNSLRGSTTARPAAAQPLPNSRGPVRYVNRVPTLDTGGDITRDGMAYLHAGERVINPRRGQGNFTFAPQIAGMSRTQVKREVNSQLDRFLDDIFGG